MHLMISHSVTIVPLSLTALSSFNIMFNSIRHQDGRTPLMMAAAGGHASVVATLLDHNAELNLSDKVRHLLCIAVANTIAILSFLVFFVLCDTSRHYHISLYDITRHRTWLTILPVWLDSSDDGYWCRTQRSGGSVARAKRRCNHQWLQFDMIEICTVTDFDIDIDDSSASRMSSDSESHGIKQQNLNSNHLTW